MTRKSNSQAPVDLLEGKKDKKEVCLSLMSCLSRSKKCLDIVDCRGPAYDAQEQLPAAG
jgi:hypothetical protein